MFTRSGRFLAAGALAAGLAASSAYAGDHFQLTILHNNDGESQLINAGAGVEDFGGAARFATLLKELKYDAFLAGESVLVLNSGDNFLAGPEFSASLDNGVPFYDTLALDLMRYDAFAIGNHEFDFGPDVLADFIEGFFKPAFFVSANLDFSLEPRLQSLVNDGKIVKNMIIEKNGEMIGIVGATTPDLPFISSPRNVIVNPDVAGTVQAQVDLLTNAGVNKIILISHLQGIESDLDLATKLHNVDIMIAGGGDELLANPENLLIPGDEGEVYGAYPLFATDADGVSIPVVTTKGNYRYVGRLMVEFNEFGELLTVDAGSGPVRVAGGSNKDAVIPDPIVQQFAVAPVIEYVSDLDMTIVGLSEVDLDGCTSFIRGVETNEGNLIADALLWQATQLAKQFDVAPPRIALQNGGGIRNNTIIPAGDITALDTFDMLPFANFVTILPDVSIKTLKAVLENAVGRINPPPGFPTGGTGRFAQIAGFSFMYDTGRDPGDRIMDVVLDDGTVLIEGGEILNPATTVSVATIDFLARGGDEYPLDGEEFISLGVTYQLALRNYIVNGLSGLITSADYPVGGEGRITRIESGAIEGFNVLFGSLLNGDAESIRNRDDFVAQARSAIGFSATEPNVLEFQVDYINTYPEATLLDTRLAMRLNNPGGEVRIRLRDVNTNSLEQVGAFTIGTAEELFQVNDLMIADYRTVDGAVEMNVKTVVAAVFSAIGFDAFIDEAQIATK